MTDPVERLTRKLIEGFVARRPLRTGSLIVSVFGDTIAPRGGVVWLGSLIRVFERIGVAHRPVRTAAYRLVQDGLLTNRAQGRRSFYALTAEGRQRFAEATLRIYQPPHADWAGKWCLVFVADLSAELRGRLRRDLQWLGFGAIAPDVLAHPEPDRKALEHHLAVLGCADSVAVFDAELPGATSSGAVRSLVRRGWDLGALGNGYARFLKQFGPVHEALGKGCSPNPEDAFFIRTFLIHEYRKVLLRDPGLPGVLLPGDWHGHAAYQLCHDVYAGVRDPAEVFVNAEFESQTGVLPPPDAAFSRRFSAPG